MTHTRRPPSRPPASGNRKEEKARGLFLGIPDWDHNQAPNATHVYGFAIRRLMTLADGCPDPEVQLAAAKFLATEFSPKAIAAPPPSETAELILKLRRTIQEALPAPEAIELETIRSKELEDRVLPEGDSE